MQATLAENRTRLVELMDRYDLSKEDVGRITRASLLTVESWLRPETSKAARNMPDNAMAVLEYSAGEDVLFVLSDIADRLKLSNKAAAAALRRSVDLFGTVLAEPDSAVKIGAVQREEAGYALFDYAGIQFLVLTNWILLPCKGKDGRSLKAALRTQFPKDGAGGWTIRNEVTEVTDALADMKRRAEINLLVSKAAEIERVKSVMEDADEEDLDDLTRTLRLLEESLVRRQQNGPRV